MNMAGENFDIVTWKIKNFSCWNQALHGKFIESPEIYFVLGSFTMKLFPRSTSGLEDRMVVHISFDMLREFSCDLSFMGADGSTLCTQQMHFKQDEGDIELPPGPKFEEMIVKSGENEFDLEDQLTLRFQVKSDRYNENQIFSVIEILDVTLEVDPSVILKDNEVISNIRYVHNECDTVLCFKTGKLSEKIELYLKYEDEEDTVYVKTHLSLISNAGSVLRHENNEHLFQNEETKPWRFSESLTKRELTENIRSIILHFKIISGIVNNILQNVLLHVDNVKIISNRFTSVSMEKSLPDQKSHYGIDQESSSVCVLLKELKCLYQGQDFSDLQVKCGDVSFPVHRNILSARSSVFRAMLLTDMTEAASGCVDIGDLDPSTLSRFLAFLYTGAVGDLDGESALKLYYAADKYLVPSLKKECVHFVSDNVSMSNVCDVLSLGDKHQDKELTSAAHNFLLRNYNDVLRSKEWNSFMCSEPLLAVKTVTHFAAKNFVLGNLNPL